MFLNQFHFLFNFDTSPVAGAVNSNRRWLFEWPSPSVTLGTDSQVKPPFECPQRTTLRHNNCLSSPPRTLPLCRFVSFVTLLSRRLSTSRFEITAVSSPVASVQRPAPSTPSPRKSFIPTQLLHIHGLEALI